MLGDSSSVLATTTTASGSRGSGCGEAAAPHLEAAVGGHHVVVGSNNNNNSNNSGDQGGVGGAGDEGDRSFGGNRWPREETLALLRIRSDMDVAFRDASAKGPLWEEVSRKLAELGYNRSAKKCKEKFENVYKYHKRTKEGRSSKQEGKTYRFFDQLEAFESHPPSSFPPPLQRKLPPPMPVANPPQPLPPASNIIATGTTVPSKNVQDQGIISTGGINLTVTNPITTTTAAAAVLQQEQNLTTNVSSLMMPSFSGDLVSNSTSSSSSSTSSDVEIQGKRKRKWKDFFEGLMKEVIRRQEDMQKRFLEAIEKREHERMAREESWRMQELARINREREILAQERSMASAKDAAVMAFLQKISEQQNPVNQLQQQLQKNQPQEQPQQPIQPIQTQPPQSAQVSAPPPPVPAPSPSPAPAPAPVVIPQPVHAVSATASQQQQQQQEPISTPPPPALARGQEVRNVDNNGDQLMTGASSSRWPKVEVEALIHLRTNLDSKYQENGPKGPLWEEISAGMKKLGYNRNAKRCKEKWENINKYFKKVKESNKKRPEDSKTCPYFQQLDALYREKNATNNLQFKSENCVPLMVRPEQQWPPPPPPSAHHIPPVSAMDDLESDQGDNDDDEDDDETGGYEIVPNNRQTSISSAG